MSKERTVIGQNIKKYREARGMTQLVLAKAAHLSPATIGHIVSPKQIDFSMG